MKSIKIKCEINYEVKDGKLISQLIPTLPVDFDFSELNKFLIELALHNRYKPNIVTKEEEIEALKKITDMLLVYIEDEYLMKMGELNEK